MRLQENYSDGAELDATVVNQEIQEEAPTEKVVTPEPEKKEETPKVETPIEEKTPPEKPTTEKVEPKEELKKEEKPPEDWNAETGYKRWKNTQSAFTKKAQEVATLRREKLELEQRLKLSEAQKGVGDFEELDQEEIDALKQEDPDAYIRYRELETQSKVGNQNVQQVQQDTVTQMNNTNTLQAITSLLGEDVEVDYSKPVKLQNQKIVDLVRSPEFGKAAEYLDQHMRPDQNGVFTPQQISDAYFLANRDNILAKERTTAAQTLKTQIDNAKITGSALDKVGKATKPDTGKTKWNNMTETELASLGFDEVEVAEKELGI